jgi:hypothetical protein
VNSLNADVGYARMLRETRADTRESIQASYFGPQHDGNPVKLDGEALSFAQRPKAILTEEQYDLIAKLNGLAGVEYPSDDALRARIWAYELAYRMQSAVPDALVLGEEIAETPKLYGSHLAMTKVAARPCLAARRMVERGVRFVQLYPSAYGVWDSHAKLK